MLDRIDLHVEVPRVEFEKLSKDNLAESSKDIRKRVEGARERQNQRFKDSAAITNSDMKNKEIKEFCKLDDSSMELMRQAVQHMHLSARSYHRILKLSRTIADLDNSNDIKQVHVAEALQYRSKE